MRRSTQLRRLSLLVTVLAVLAAGCAAFPQPKTETLDGIEGTYYVNGTDSLGTEYGGRLEITPGEQPDEYEMQWIISGSIQVGTGVQSDGRVDAVWKTIDGLTDNDGGARSSGTAEYTVEADGTLRGTRTTDGVDGTGTEEAFPVAE
ncbi:MAG: hypothetical protein ABFR89_12445 [Actinomycetota bacterium]